MSFEIQKDLTLLLPECALATGMLAVLTRDLVPEVGGKRVPTWLGLAAAVAAALFAWQSPTGAVGSMLTVDGMANLARIATAALTALLLLARFGERDDGRDDGAFVAALLALALGGMLTATAAHFVPLWLGLELIALPSYVLVAWRVGDARAAEAGMKFVLFGGAASAAMLFGISHLYGLSGCFDFAGVGSSFAGGMAPLTLGALGLAGVGLATKLTLVPFHFYAPDVYQGAPSLSVAAVSALPKVGVAAAVARGLSLLLPSHVVPANTLATGLAIAAAASVLFAAITALVQRDGKRILAFSGIGHGAAVVLAIGCAPDRDALGAAAFYLLTYTLANVGAFVCLAVLERTRGSASLAELAGAGKRHPVVTAVLCLFLASLAGVPPLAGFLGKWNVLQVAFARGLSPDGAPALAVAALLLVIATAVSAWSYLLIVRAVAFADAPVDGERPAARPALATVVVLALCALGTVVCGLWLSGAGVLARAL